MEIRCDVCGYPRTGLPAESLCPECGHTAPRVIEPALHRPGAAVDRSEQAWLMSVLVGLVLLVITGLIALRVALVMPLGGLVLAVINAPGPKLWAGALLQRQIGQPGPWGVLGTLAVLGNVLAIWLITEPRAIADPLESSHSIRRLARWSCVLLCGGFIGLLWGTVDISRRWGWDGLPAVAVAVGLVELIVNTFVYIHLGNLAVELAERGPYSRACRLLRLSAWLVPAVCLVGALMSLIRGAMQDQPIVPWRIAQTVYGSAALAAGMLMTAGVFHLAASVAAAAMDRSIATLTDVVSRLPASLAKMLSAINARPMEWLTAAGVALWLWNTRPLLALTTLMVHRAGFGSDLPAINFIGPKIWAVALLGRGGRFYYSDEIIGTSAIYTTIFAVWMITTFRPTDLCKRVAPLVRWAPTALIGLALGLAITMAQGSAWYGSRWTAALMVGIEAPCTALMYGYLALLAAAIGQPAIAKHLRIVVVIAVFSILSPIGFYILAKPMRAHIVGPAAMTLSAVYGVITVTAGVFAWAVLARLIWALIAPTMHNHDRAHASPNPQ